MKLGNNVIPEMTNKIFVPGKHPDGTDAGYYAPKQDRIEEK